MTTRKISTPCPARRTSFNRALASIGVTNMEEYMALSSSDDEIIENDTSSSDEEVEENSVAPNDLQHEWRCVGHDGDVRETDLPEFLGTIGISPGKSPPAISLYSCWSSRRASTSSDTERRSCRYCDETAIHRILQSAYGWHRFDGWLHSSL